MRLLMHLQTIRELSLRTAIVTKAQTEDDLFDLFDVDPYDVILADDYIDPRRVRNHGIHVPLIMATGVHDGDYRAKLLEHGADYCLTQPFVIHELEAILQVCERRFAGLPSNIIEVDDMVVDLTTESVWIGGESIHLTRTEWRFLRTLITRPNRIITKDAMLSQLYDNPDGEPQCKIVDVFLCKLRKKLGENGDKIVTVWGQGLKWEHEQCVH